MTGLDLRTAFDHLWSEVAPLGREPTGGWCRTPWSAADRALRTWFVRQAQARGLHVDRDGNTNLWAWLGEPGPAAVVTGSHLDSVPGGGAYDGALGVIGALLALDDLRDRGVRPARPLAVTVFTEEEGARFGVACLGSRLLVGDLEPDQVRALVDRDGTALAEVLGVDADRLGADPGLLGRIGAFVELHIEQGRELTRRDAPVGLATGIWPHGVWRLRFDGEGNHAGTTALADRHDPVLPCAATAAAARDAAARHGALATVGRLEVLPGAAGAVASQATAWLDARAPDPAALTAVVEDVERAARAAAKSHGVAVRLETASVEPEVVFDPELRGRLSTALGGVPEIATGAGHDAGTLARHVPAAMLFVRNPTGVSHSPAEYADPDDCVAGIRALSRALEVLVA